MTEGLKPDREAVARIIGSFVVYDDNGGPDTEVLADVIGGDCDEANRRIYSLTDAILSLFSPPPEVPRSLEGEGRAAGDNALAHVADATETEAQNFAGVERRLRAAAFEVVAATEQKPDGTWAIGWDGELLISALAEAVGPMFCSGCGGTKGIAEIRAGGFVSCCPERSMHPPAESGASDGGDGVPVHERSAPDAPETLSPAEAHRSAFPGEPGLGGSHD